MKKLILGALLCGAYIAADAAPAIETLDGAWDWNYWSLLKSTAGAQTKKAYIEITDAAAGKLTVNFAGSYEVAASYDQETGNLTMVPGQNCGYNSQYDMNIDFLHLRMEDGKTTVVDTPLTAKIDGVTFLFDPNDVIAFGNPTKGYMICGDENQLRKVVYGTVDMPEEGWESIGVCPFFDGWHHVGIFHEDAVPYQVEVEKNVEQPGLMRIKNAYGPGTMIYDSGDNVDPDAQGYIFFSIADPEFVCVYPTIYSGYNDKYFGPTSNYNLEGKFATLYERTKEEILKYGLLVEEPSYYDETEKTVHFHNLFFGLPGDLTGDYGWTTNYEHGWLTLPGGSSVTELQNVEDGVEAFFNLQGQPLAAPVSGEVVIVRKGTKAIKKAY